MRWQLVCPLGLLLTTACASTQLNHNTLDLGSTVEQLLTAQVVYNLAKFIETPLAVPSQLVINGGSAQTANTLNAQSFNPLMKAVTVAATATSATTTKVDAAKTMTLSGTNVATQNWSFEPVNDADQLRRLYALYRFVIAGNNDRDAQKQLLTDYPIHNVTSSGDTVGMRARDVPLPDPTALIGPNCVLCTKGTENAANSEAACGLRAIPLDIVPKRALCINKRLLPSEKNRAAWLRWTGGRPCTSTRKDPYSCDPQSGDLVIGQAGATTLYVDGNQPDRYPEFALFISAAAESSQSPSSSAGARKGRAQPAGLILGIPQ